MWWRDVVVEGQQRKGRAQKTWLWIASDLRSLKLWIEWFTIAEDWSWSGTKLNWVEDNH